MSEKEFSIKRMKDLDVNVNEVFYSHPVYQRIREQIGKGILKYNTPVQPDHYSIFGWFNHLQQENTDKIVYNEIIKMKLEEVIKTLQTAYKTEDHTTKDIHIDHALSILLDCKEGNS
jgi:galactokinase/mevalonate kinase-like predicted kinase